MPPPPKEPVTIPVPEPAPVVQLAPSIAAEANKNLAAVKPGFDPLRPVKLTQKFVGGTFMEGLNGMARFGRKGLWVGVGLGIVGAIATGGLAPLFGFALAGLAVGMAAGGLKGVLTGGMDAVGRDNRAKLYADDLIQRKSVQEHAAPNLKDYRAAYREQQLSNSYRTQQLIERTNENTRDFNTYWQDRESDRANRLPQEKGLGF